MGGRRLPFSTGIRPRYGPSKADGISRERRIPASAASSTRTGASCAKSELFEQKILVEDLKFLRHRTLYSRIGDTVAWLSLALTAAVFLATRRVG